MNNFLVSGYSRMRHAVHPLSRIFLISLRRDINWDSSIGRMIGVNNFRKPSHCSVSRWMRSVPFLFSMNSYARCPLIPAPSKSSSRWEYGSYRVMRDLISPFTHGSIFTTSTYCVSTSTGPGVILSRRITGESGS